MNKNTWQEQLAAIKPLVKQSEQPMKKRVKKQKDAA